MAKGNLKLGSVVVHGVQQAPHGVAKIEVAMTTNDGGLLLVVEAADRVTGVAITATVQSGSNLSKDAVMGMIAEAQAHKGDDDRMHKRADSVDSLARREVPGEPLRAMLAQRVAEWRRWSEDSRGADAADCIRQYFAVRRAAKRMLAGLPPDGDGWRAARRKQFACV
jgi:molecular chaperone DnaK